MAILGFFMWCFSALVWGQTIVSTPMIANGSFEDGLAPWWGKGEVVQGGAAEGASALRLSGGYVVQDKLLVEGGNRYRIRMQIRSDAAIYGTVYVQLSFRGKGVTAGWYGPASVAVADRSEPALFVAGGSYKWQVFEVVMQAPVGASELLLYLRKGEGTAGLAYFDAVSVEPTDADPDTAKELRRRVLRDETFGGKLSTEKVGVLNGSWEHLAIRNTDRLELSSNGLARYRIVVSPDADLLVLNAAGDLARYLGKITGTSFLPLSLEDDGRPTIIVGPDAEILASLAPNISLDGLGEDGFVIRSVGHHLIIAGQTPRGSMYGVNWFLDRVLGVRWLSPSYTFVPSQSELSISPINIRQQPRFSYREVLSIEGENKWFRARNLLNGESHGPSYRPSPPEIDSWDRSWLVKDSSATFWSLLNKKGVERAKPDWFAGGQVAMMSDDVRAATAAGVIKRLINYDDYSAIWFDVRDMDWGWDMDSESHRFAERHGGFPSAPRLDMMIDVANRVRKTLPDARLAFNAYHWSFSPPTEMKVPDHILVFPMTIHVDYRFPLYEGNNLQLGRDIEAWSKIAKNVLVWDHIVNFSGYLQPTPNIYPIGKSIRWLAGLPTVKGYFAEGSWNTRSAEFAALRVWLIARLLWDPTQDIHALVAEYCRDYFGAAGPLMLQYIDLMHDAIARSGDVLAEKAQVDLKMYDLDFIKKADRLFDLAEHAVTDDFFRLHHVKAARLSVDYVALLRRNEYLQLDAAAGGGWSLDFERRRERFFANAKLAGVSQYRQGGGIEELAAIIDIPRKTPSLPPVSIYRPVRSSSWVDYQDLSFNRYFKTPIVADLVSSDGAAIQVKNSGGSWVVQFKFDKLPEKGEWDIFIAVRSKYTPNLPKQGVVKVGSYPPMNLFVSKPIAELPEDEYLYIKVPGGPFLHSVSHDKGIYLQVSGSQVAEVLVDRLIAVRRINHCQIDLNADISDAKTSTQHASGDFGISRLLKNYFASLNKPQNREKQTIEGGFLTKNLVFPAYADGCFSPRLIF